MQNTHNNFLNYAPAPDGVQIFFINQLKKQNILLITLDDKKIDELSQMAELFLNNYQIITLTAWDTIPYDRISPNVEILNNRIATLSQLALNQYDSKPTILITSVNAFLQKLPPKEIIKKACFKIKKGDSLNQEILSLFLVENGYKNSPLAQEQGEFSVRGGIIDIVPINSAYGYRIDFFGDDIENIKLYDLDTQISIQKENTTEIILFPASEVLLNDKTISQFKQKYHSFFGTQKNDDIYDTTLAHHHISGQEQFLPLFYEKLDNIFSYFEAEKIIYSPDTQTAITERLATINEHYQTRIEFKDKIKKLDESDYHALPPEELYILEEELQAILSNKQVLVLNRFNQENSTPTNFKSGKNYIAESKAQRLNVFDILREDFKNAINKKSFYISCISEGSRERLEKILKERELPFVPLSNYTDIAKYLHHKNLLKLVVLRQDEGFETPDLLLVTEQDLFGEKISIAKKRKVKAEELFAQSNIFNIGELVVHKYYGIGRFEGLKNIQVKDYSHDFIKLNYAEDSTLYVPIENIDLISHYGSFDGEIRLDKLGSASWQQRASGIKNRLKLMAEQLLKIAAERELKTAQNFTPFESSYREFCAKFPYAETEDQLQAIADVSADLSSGKAMDRLICGDVGFGKTEVALRATAIVVLAEDLDPTNPPQVAVICPTTILARQHYQNFQKRFDGILKAGGKQVKIAHLSRLISASDRKKTKLALANGEIDIIIGTHALLSKELEFKNLNLVIVDEEQKFGVAQKEKLRGLKASTHMLSMTATPIPRTLQLSLSGIRDLSIIATPPIDRLAVRTFVMPYDSVIVREAILREFYRGGKCFYVAPRVKDLDELYHKLHDLVPEVRIEKAHGQMDPEVIDNIMNDFYDGKFQVLLSTTIVESGLDIPNVNTMILHRSDMYGLAQLYQIRGRVGRGRTRAYAYLTTPKNKLLTKDATKRLEVLEKLDRLGSGFSLASHDMDIRGYGNLLGEEQSGTVKEVGIELYQAMLREAIQNLQYSELERERKGMNTEFSPVINLDFSVLIPEFYIPDLSLRMSFYRKIANLKDDAEVDNILYELSDRFGSAPIEVKNLMEVVKLKNLAIHANVEKIEQGSKAIVLKFYQNKSKNAEKLLKFIMANPKRYQLKPDNKLLYKIDEVIVNNAYKGGIPANENNKNNISSNDYIFKEIRKVLAEVIACS